MTKERQETPTAPTTTSRMSLSQGNPIKIAKPDDREVPFISTYREKTALWEYVSTHTHDTVESMAELRKKLPQDIDDLDVEDIIRRERKKLDTTPLDETDRQIIQLILDSKRHWNDDVYLTSLAQILKHDSEAPISVSNLRDWMAKMQYMDSRSGIITGKKVLQNDMTRKNTCKVNEVPIKNGWTLYQTVEGVNIPGTSS